MKLSETGITVRKILYSPAAIYIEYPNGDIWEYVIYDDHTLRDIIKRYRRNMGRFVTAIKQAASDSRMVRPGKKEQVA